ncbi:protein kinase domain-containing protein [Lentzea sp. NPDC055074]
MEETSRLIGSRYQLKQKVGQGAMGVVWQAYDEQLHRVVAAKELLGLDGLDDARVDRAKARAMREARLAARLEHPNAIRVYDVVEEDGRPWLIMEYLPSRSLAAVITEQGTLPPREVARIGCYTAAALAAAHRHGIQHRDVKPGNVLIGDQEVKITDFGISRATGEDATATATGTVGTPAFFSPEVARGEDAGLPSDVFSLGATLYNAVEGGPPFGTADNNLVMLHRVASGSIMPPANAGPLLSPVLFRLLATDPQRRPSMQEAVHLLAAVVNETPQASQATVVIPATVKLPVEAQPEEKARQEAAAAAAGLVAGAAAVEAAGLTAPPAKPATKPYVTPEPPAANEDSAGTAEGSAAEAGAGSAEAAAAGKTSAEGVDADASKASAEDDANKASAESAESDAGQGPAAAGAAAGVAAAGAAASAGTTPDAESPESSGSEAGQGSAASAGTPAGTGAAAAASAAAAAKSTAGSQPAQLATPPASPARQTLSMAGAGSAASVAPAAVPPPGTPPVPPAESGERRRKFPLVPIAIVLLVIAVGVGSFLLWPKGGGGNQNAQTPGTNSQPSSGAPNQSAGQTTDQSQPQQPGASQTQPPATSGNTPPAGTPSDTPQPPAGPKNAQEAITAYYALIPGDLQTGYASLTDRFKAVRAPSFQAYQTFWGKYSAVQLSNFVPQGDNVVTVTVQYVQGGAVTDTETHTYTFVQQNGKWLIDNQA